MANIEKDQVYRKVFLLIFGRFLVVILNSKEWTSILIKEGF